MSESKSGSVSPPSVSVFPRPHGALLRALIDRAQALPPIRMGVVHPCDRPSLEGALAARDAGLIVPTLIGPCKKMEAAARAAGVSLEDIDVVEAPHSHAAADQAVEMARRGKLHA